MWDTLESVNGLQLVEQVAIYFVRAIGSICLFFDDAQVVCVYFALLCAFRKVNFTPPPILVVL